MNKRGVPADRVIWKDAGYREEATIEIWIFPRNIEPYASPTVNRGKVEILKNCKSKNQTRRQRINRKPRTTALENK